LRRALAVQPLIAVGVVEVPMGVDQVVDRIEAEAVLCFQDARTRRSDTIDEHLAVGAGQDGDVAA